MNFLSLLAETTTPPVVEMELMDRFILGLEVAGIGILVVFCILLILIGVIKILQYCSRNPGKYTEPAKRAVKGFFHKIGLKIKSIFVRSKKVENENTDLQAMDIANESNESEEVVAAIMAALNCFYDQENSNAGVNVGFKVRSIKRN